MENVQEYFTRLGDGDQCVLVKCDGEQPSQFLALSRKSSGRLDLVDLGCNDTGSDLRDLTVTELRTMAEDWMRSILSGCSAEDRDDVESEILPQIESMSE